MNLHKSKIAISLVFVAIKRIFILLFFQLLTGNFSLQTGKTTEFGKNTAISKIEFFIKSAHLALSIFQ